MPAAVRPGASSGPSLAAWPLEGAGSAWPLEGAGSAWPLEGAGFSTLLEGAISGPGSEAMTMASGWARPPLAGSGGGGWTGGRTALDGVGPALLSREAAERTLAGPAGGFLSVGGSWGAAGGTTTGSRFSASSAPAEGAGWGFSSEQRRLEGEGLEEGCSAVRWAGGRRSDQSGPARLVLVGRGPPCFGTMMYHLNSCSLKPTSYKTEAMLTKCVVEIKVI